MELGDEELGQLAMINVSLCDGTIQRSEFLQWKF